MVGKEEMIEVFEDLYAHLKMETMTNREDIKGNRQLFGQIQGFFMAMKMVMPLDMDELQYVEHRLKSLEERIH
jgi:hypothetical protein